MLSPVEEVPIKNIGDSDDDDGDGLEVLLSSVVENKECFPWEDGEVKFIVSPELDEKSSLEEHMMIFTLLFHTQVKCYIFF